jgi:hypothetical protein
MREEKCRVARLVVRPEPGFGIERRIPVEEQEKVTSEEEAEVEAHKKKSSATEEPQSEEGSEDDFELHRKKKL